MIHTIIGLEDIFGEGYGVCANEIVTECVGNGLAFRDEALLTKSELLLRQPP